MNRDVFVEECPRPQEEQTKENTFFEDREVGDGEDIASIERVYRFAYRQSSATERG